MYDTFALWHEPSDLRLSSVCDVTLQTVEHFGSIFGTIKKLRDWTF